MKVGDWVLGIGQIPNPQSPIPIIKILQDFINIIKIKIIYIFLIFLNTKFFDV